MPKLGERLAFRVLAHFPERPANVEEHDPGRRKSTSRAAHHSLQGADLDAQQRVRYGATADITWTRDEDKTEWLLYTYTAENLPEHRGGIDDKSAIEETDRLLRDWYIAQGFEPKEITSGKRAKPREDLRLADFAAESAPLPEERPVPENRWRKFKGQDYVLAVELKHVAKLAGVDLGEMHTPDGGSTQVSVDIPVLLDLLERLRNAEKGTTE